MATKKAPMRKASKKMYVLFGCGATFHQKVYPKEGSVSAVVMPYVLHKNQRSGFIYFPIFQESGRDLGELRSKVLSYVDKIFCAAEEHEERMAKLPKYKETVDGHQKGPQGIDGIGIPTK